MADRDEGTDIDKLLAEVERSLGGKPPATPAGGEAARSEAGSGGLVSRARGAAMGGAAAAAVVWVIFALLPFLRAPSGAIGAFIAAFVAVFVLRRK